MPVSTLPHRVRPANAAEASAASVAEAVAANAAVTVATVVAVNAVAVARSNPRTTEGFESRPLRAGFLFDGPSADYMQARQKFSYLCRTET